jgi:hypothetical protein
MLQYPYFLAGEIKLMNPKGAGMAVDIIIAKEIRHADAVLL